MSPHQHHDKESSTNARQNEGKKPPKNLIKHGDFH
jgi:hypothetical protein